MKQNKSAEPLDRRFLDDRKSSGFFDNCGARVESACSRWRVNGRAFLFWVLVRGVKMTTVNDFVSPSR